MNPLQAVVEWVSDRSLVEYLKEHPEANRISLVSPLLSTAFAGNSNGIFRQVIRHS